jgi:hypothetical protein
VRCRQATLRRLGHIVASGRRRGGQSSPRWQKVDCGARRRFKLAPTTQGKGGGCEARMNYKMVARGWSEKKRQRHYAQAAGKT